MQDLPKNGSAANLRVFPGSWFAWNGYGADVIYSFSDKLRAVKGEKVLEFGKCF